MLVLFRRGLKDFNSQSDFINLTENLKTHSIKIVATECFACAAHQGTKHLIQIESNRFYSITFYSNRIKYQ